MVDGIQGTPMRQVYNDWFDAANDSESLTGDLEVSNIGIARLSNISILLSYPAGPCLIVCSTNNCSIVLLQCFE